METSILLFLLLLLICLTNVYSTFSPSKPTFTMSKPVTKEEVEELQAAWSSAITTCSSLYASNGDCLGAAQGAAAELYGYGHFPILFKPVRSQHNTP